MRAVDVYVQGDGDIAVVTVVDRLGNHLERFTVPFRDMDAFVVQAARWRHRHPRLTIVRVA